MFVGEVTVKERLRDKEVEVPLMWFSVSPVVVVEAEPVGAAAAVGGKGRVVLPMFAD
jgi:hypothetical protein